MTTIRRFAAILAADVAGYSRMIGADEAGTLARLRTIRAEVIDPAIAAHNGRLVKTTGDGFLVEYGSVVDALRSASEIQAGMVDRNATVPQDQRIEFRMGLNVGDVVVENGDIFGDGVNVAARLEGLAEPGGICVSARVQEDAAGKLNLAFEDMGEQQLKNIARPVRAYRVRDSAAPRTQPPPSPQVLPPPDTPSIAVLPFANMSGGLEQEYFADGMVEEIITALSRIHWLFVIARNSSFTYKGQAVDVKQVGREIGCPLRATADSRNGERPTNRAAAFPSQYLSRDGRPAPAVRAAATVRPSAAVRLSAAMRCTHRKMGCSAAVRAATTWAASYRAARLLFGIKLNQFAGRFDQTPSNSK